MNSADLQNLRRRLWSPAVLTSLTLALIWVLAVIFRLSDLAARDLWTDEAWVALAALKADPGAALAAGHSTPPLYMLTVWAAARLLGSQEWALRSLSFAFGLGTLLFFWLLVRRLVSRHAALLALAMVAFSPIMVYYSKELKQYSGDACFAVLMVYLAERLRESHGRRGWLPLALAGIVGLGFSHPLVFCLPAVGLMLWINLPAVRGRLAILGGLWMLSFGVYYFLFFRHEMDPELVAYWARDYPDFSGLWPFCRWLGSALYRYFWYFFGEWGPIWGPPLFLAGAYAMYRSGGSRVLVYFSFPILLAFIAAALHRYPFMGNYGGNRLMLFTAPLLYLLVAAGFCLVFSRLWRGRLKWVAAGLAVALFLSLNPLLLPRENLRPLMNREEISPLVARLQQELQPQDWIYVYHFAKWPFGYYFRGEGLRGERLCIGKSCVETGLKLDPKKKPGRLWLIASHIPDLKDMREFAAKLLGPGWRETACYQSEGAVLFCFYAPKEEKAVNGPEPPVSAAATLPGEKACK
ncbi:MAG: glycosyltransferase family 39 protein [Deltaproteobacteria bacterium]|nr:glycosyltransferase family 39 protein [Deltaproteobacteria bacterium]